MRKKSFKRLLPQKFDADLLHELTNEGCVYINVPQCVAKEVYKREIIDYVQAISEFVAEAWKGQIGTLWNDIVDAPCMSDFLVMKRGELSGHMNRYAVTNLVCRMQHLGVYRKDVPMLTLHLRLERTGKKNKFYKCSRNYHLPREARDFLKSFFFRKV